jgi:hypothetical protein
MAYELKQLEGEPIIVVTYKEPYSPGEDVIQTNRLVAQKLDNIEGAVYLINDIREVNLTFSRVVQTMAAAFNDNTTLAPNRIHGIAVGASKMLKLFVDSAKQMQYGNIDVVMFDTAEEAIEYARKKLAEEKQDV